VVAVSLVGFKARNHRQQTAKRGPNPKVDDRATTPEMFADLSERFGPFTIDVAAASHNTKCERFYTIDDDGLAQSWAGERVWCNPPFSDVAPWVAKAWESGAETVVMLLPANRTEQVWWQEMVEPFRGKGLLDVHFLPGRPRFIEPGDDAVKPNARPPFGCCVLVWRVS
jgi:phage N-6-adenine-methyltransferase